MNRPRDAPSASDWIDAPENASLTDVFGSGAQLRGAFESFYTSALHHLRVHPGETLQAVDRVPSRDRRRLDPRDRARLMRLRANALLFTGQLAAASRTYARVWKRLRTSGDGRELALTGVGWIGALSELGRYQDVGRLATACRRALPRGETVLRALIDANHGSMLVLMCRYDAAIDLLKSARRRFRSAGRLTDAGSATINLGHCWLSQGQPRRARPFYSEAAEQFASLGIESLHLLARAGSALTDLLEGRWEGASDSLEEIVRSLDAMDDHMNVVFVQHQQAQFLFAVGALEPAETLASRALARARKLRASHDIAELSFLHGRILAALERFVDAKVRLDDALRHWTRHGHARARHRTTVEIAAVVLARGDPEEALRILRGSSAYLSRNDRGGSSARCRHLMAVCYLQLGQANQASRLAQAAFRQATAYPARFERPWIAATVARAVAESGRDREALQWARRSIRLLENLYLTLGTQSMRGQLSGSREKLYREAVNLALSLKRVDSSRIALDFITRARSPELVEDLLQSRTELSEPIRLAIARLRDAFLGDIPTEDRDVRGANLRREMKKLDTALTRRKGRAPGIVREAIARRGFDRWVRLLDGRSLVLYEEDGNGDGYSAYVVTGARRVVHTRLPAAREAIEEVWLPARMTLEQASQLDEGERAPFLAATAEESVQALQELRARLWDPLDVPPGPVVLVAGSELHGIPLEAIVQSSADEPPGQWSIARWPHPSLLDRGPRRGHRTGLLLHDRAPKRRREVQRVAGILRRRGFQIEIASSRRAFTRSRSPVGVLHVAAHGAFHRPRWMLNGVRLPDGWIGFEQLDRRELRHSLVFFSSCESGLQSEIPGSEFDGWMSAALGAGVREIVLTLWKIDDDSAVRFSSAFYTHWANGVSAPEAAARARREIRIERPHPYSWAPFVALG